MKLKPTATCLALLLSAGIAAAQQGAPGGPPPTMEMPDATSQQMPGGPMGGRGMRGMHSTGDVDRDFALMMRRHHQVAIDMAKAELAQGRSDELKALAREIIDDQQRELVQLDQWLARNR